MHERYVPLDQANTQRVQFNLAFPMGVDRNQIGIDIMRVERLCRLSGIKQLRVLSQTGLETSGSVPTVIGSNQDGEAYAGRIGKTKQVPTYTVKSYHDYEPDAFWEKLQPFRQICGIITVNTDEVTTKIARDSKWKTGVRSTDAWTHYLDHTLREGIGTVGADNLLGVDSSQKSLFAGLTGFGYLLGTSAELPYAPGLLSLVPAILMHHQFVGMASTYWSGRKDGFRGDFRWSLFYGIEPERAAILAIMTARKGLVKKMGPQK